MAYRTRISYTAARKADIRDRWQRGESLTSIGRLFDRPSSSIFNMLAPTGGIRQPPRQLSRLALTPAEREEISRGLARRLLPFYEAHNLPVLQILADRGTEYCGRVETHDYQLFLAINDIDHTKTKAHSSQTNGICKRFHKTILQEFYQATFRKKLYGNRDELQSDLDVWLGYCNNERTHRGKMCCGRMPMQTLEDGK